MIVLWFGDVTLALLGVALVAYALVGRRYRPAPPVAPRRPPSPWTPTRVIDGRTYPSAALQRTLDEGREYDRQQAAITRAVEGES